MRTAPARSLDLDLPRALGEQAERLLPSGWCVRRGARGAGRARGKGQLHCVAAHRVARGRGAAACAVHIAHCRDAECSLLFTIHRQFVYVRVWFGEQQAQANLEPLA